MTLRRLRLLIVMIGCGLVLATRSSNADELFTESFDGGLGAWNVLHPHFSTAGGVLRGNGDGARGAMFRDAAGVVEVRFSFLRTENSAPQSFGDHIEVGVTQGEFLTVPYNSIGGGSNTVVFQADARQPVHGPDAGFYVYSDGGSTLLTSWNVLNQLTDETWYDGVILIMPDNTATFGLKPSSDSEFVYSTGHPLPPGFVGAHVGVTAYRVPPSDGATGVELLDNISAYSAAPSNEPPDVSNASPSVALVWPPNHKFVSVSIHGVTDPEGDPITITIDSIFQDEPVDSDGKGKHVPDGQGVGTSTTQIRAERLGNGNGRVYHIEFTADDGNGGLSSGEVAVGVPHNQGQTPVDGGALYDSTVAP